MNNILQKLNSLLPGVQSNVLLRDYTTYKIGGPAKYFFVARTREGLIDAVGVAKKLKLKVFILGGGSNLLVSDKGFNGLVIKMEISNMDFLGGAVTVGAGANLTKLAYLSAEKNLSGMEWAAGIPGTVGGAIYGHAQAFGTKISEAISSVDAVDLRTLKIRTLNIKQCHFSLKNSIFKKNKNLVIISSVLKFKPDQPENIKNRIKEFLDYRKTKHPIDLPSAGSTFVNPQLRIKNKKLLKKFPELAGYNEKGIIPAGFMIAKSGLAGKKIGKAMISEKHSNFIVNLGEARARDVLALLNLAKARVKKNFGITLVPEVVFVGLGGK